MARKINGRNREKVTERWKILHNGKLPDSSVMLFILLADMILVQKSMWISQDSERRKMGRPKIWGEIASLGTWTLMRTNI
jgi:hypothetical protein